MVELESGNYHPMIQSVFPDGNIGNWVIDTGASRTVFDIGQDRYYLLIDESLDKDTLSTGIGVGSLETKTGEIKRISFGKLNIDKLNVSLLDLSHINSLYKKYTSEKICGLLGSDFLLRYNALIDYKRKELNLNEKS